MVVGHNHILSLLETELFCSLSHNIETTSKIVEIQRIQKTQGALGNSIYMFNGISIYNIFINFKQ